MRVSVASAGYLSLVVLRLMSEYRHLDFIDWEHNWEKRLILIWTLFFLSSILVGIRLLDLVVWLRAAETNFFIVTAKRSHEV